MTEYTVEVNTLRQVRMSYGVDWDITGSRTVITTETIELAIAVFTSVCYDEVRYSDRLALDERTVVSLVKWPETGFGETLQYAEFDHDGRVEL